MSPAPAGATTQAAVQAVAGSFSFGTRSVLDSSPIAHTFLLKAGERSAVVVDRLQPSCHCTRATAEGGTDGYGRFTIPPGKTVRIDVTVNPGDMIPGTVGKEVYVFVNGESVPEVTLHITGFITLPVAVAPSVLDFGAVTAGTTHTLSLAMTLDPAVLTPGRVAHLVCSDPRLAVTLQGTATSSPNTQEYRVGIPAGMPAGKFHATLSLVLSPRVPASDFPVTIPVQGEVLAPVPPNPARD